MLAKATILGNIGKKEYSELRNGGNYLLIAIATKNRYKDASGESHEDTSWHNVTFYNKLADLVNRNVVVGDLIYCEGEISNRKAEECGGKFWRYGVTGTHVKFLPNPHRHPEHLLKFEPEER
jgi:single-strand DNA-binding protein